MSYIQDKSTKLSYNKTVFTGLTTSASNKREVIQMNLQKTGNNYMKIWKQPHPTNKMTPHMLLEGSKLYMYSVNTIVDYYSVCIMYFPNGV